MAKPTTRVEHDANDSRNEWLAQLKIAWDRTSDHSDCEILRRSLLRQLALRLAALSPHPDVTDVDRDEVRTLIMAARYVTQ